MTPIVLGRPQGQILPVPILDVSYTRDRDRTNTGRRGKPDVKGNMDLHAGRGVSGPAATVCSRFAALPQNRNIPATWERAGAGSS
jgi:hypothetical protein